MSRVLLPLVGAVVACTPTPQDAAMSSSKAPEAADPPHDPFGVAGRLPAAYPAPIRQGPAGPGTADPAQAAQGPLLEPVSAAENLLPVNRPDSPEEARGRQVLSTAFVMIGPDGHLTVELRDGNVLVLRDVTMNRKDYCGVEITGGVAGKRRCGGYAEIVAARPGR